MLNLEKIEKITTIYGYFYSKEADLMTNQLKKYSAHTRNELAMLKSLITDGENIIDIGAHIGSFSIPFARFNKGSGKIFSFEANIDNYALLKLNVSENMLGDVIIPIHAIVSDCAKKFTMLNSSDDNTGEFYFMPNLSFSDVTMSDTDVINIDEWYEINKSDTQIDLIKIDIEGAEMAALRSCEKIIKRYLPMMYIEINKKALDRFNTPIAEIEDALKSFGYHFFRNRGPRNSNNDIFKIARLDKIEDGGVFFDLLAIHPSSSKYPNIP